MTTHHRVRIAAIVAATMAGLSYTAPAIADGSVTISYRDAFTTELPGSASGRSFADEFNNSVNPQAKPPALSHFHLQLPAGARFDTTAIPQCEAADLELMLIGTSACPTTSKIGTETFVFDTGLSGPSRFDTNDVTFFNQLNGLIILSQDRQTGLRVVTHGTISTGTEDIELPLLPGTPPDGGADRQETAQYPVATGHNDGQPTAYLTTPPVCPPAREWIFQATYTFHDGTRQTLTSPSPCQSTAPGSGTSSHQPANTRRKRRHRHATRHRGRRPHHHRHRGARLHS